MSTSRKTIIIRGLDESTKKQLQARASSHGRSLEEEALEILKTALAKNLGERIHARFAALGGFELPDIPRESMRELPSFDA